MLSIMRTASCLTADQTVSSDSVASSVVCRLGSDPDRVSKSCLPRPAQGNWEAGGCGDGKKCGMGRVDRRQAQGQPWTGWCLMAGLTLSHATMSASLRLHGSTRRGGGAGAAALAVSAASVGDGVDVGGAAAACVPSAVDFSTASASGNDADGAVAAGSSFESGLCVAAVPCVGDTEAAAVAAAAAVGEADAGAASSSLALFAFGAWFLRPSSGSDSRKYCIWGDGGGERRKHGTCGRVREHMDGEASAAGGRREAGEKRRTTRDVARKGGGTRVFDK